MKRYTRVLLVLSLLLLLTGCAKKDPEPETNEPPAPAAEQTIVAETPPEAPADTPDAEPDDASAVYELDGLTVPIPTEYVDALIIETDLEPLSEHWEPLISLAERASVEAGEKDHPGEDWGDGWLCSVSRLDRIGFESWASGDDTGTSIFARDGADNYYLVTRPTDVRLYRSGSENAPIPPADLEAWNRLNDWAETLPADIIERNDLTAYDARDLLGADFTYSGEHVELGCRFPGEPMDLVVFSLSQPARQGEGGVWCVERLRYVYSSYDWEETHLVFPAALGVDRTAADYYAQLQAECDTGEHAELLTPLGAALDYARRITWLVGEDVSASDFEVIESLG